MRNDTSDHIGETERIDYVIILGCRLDGAVPGICLTERIRTAEQVLRQHPEAMAVASGGQGSNEDISEAEAIARMLADMGIPEERIIKEDESHSTYENLVFSKAIMDRYAQGKAYQVAVVTNSFHIYRSRRLAKYVGLQAVAVAAPTPERLLLPNLIREICSVVVAWIRFR